MVTGALLAAQVAAGLIQAGAGAIKANRLERPEYQIPASIEANMSMSQRMAFQGLPDEQKQEFIQELNRQTAGSLQGLSDRKAGIGAISAVDQRAKDASMKLLSMDTQQRMSNIQNLMNMRSQYAQYSDKKFMMNEMQPFQQELQSAQQFQSAGLQNIVGGIGSIASLEMEGINPFQRENANEDNMFSMSIRNMFQSLMGGNKTDFIEQQRLGEQPSINMQQFGGE